jgi:hypothetical protein
LGLTHNDRGLSEYAIVLNAQYCETQDCKDCFE